MRTKRHKTTKNRSKKIPVTIKRRLKKTKSRCKRTKKETQRDNKSDVTRLQGNFKQLRDTVDTKTSEASTFLCPEAHCLVFVNGYSLKIAAIF